MVVYCEAEAMGRRRGSITLKCPVFVYETDDICGQEIELDAWPEEPMTHWYPGSPAGFEIVDAPCGHAAEIEDKYWDVIMEHLGERELDAQSAAIDAKIAAWEEEYDCQLELDYAEHTNWSR